MSRKHSWATLSCHNFLNFTIPIFSNYKRFNTCRWWNPVSHRRTAPLALFCSTLLQEHTAESSALLGSGSGTGDDRGNPRLCTEYDHEEDWKLVQPTILHVVCNYCQLQGTILEWGIIKWYSTLITFLLFE